MKKTFASVLVLLVINLVSLPGSAQQPNKEELTKEEKHAHKIKKYVSRLDRWASDDPVTVKLYDGAKVKGYIAGVTDDDFVVADRHGRQLTIINYSQVKDISSGFGTRSKIALAVSGGILAIV